MRLNTNFVFPYDRTIPLCAGAGWFAAVLGLTLGIYLTMGALRMRAETPALSGKLDQLTQKGVVSVKPADMPSPAALAAFQKRLKKINRLQVGGGLPVSGILSHLEALMPKGARLLSLKHEQHSGEVQLVMEGKDPAVLSQFLNGMEKDAVFSKAVLTRQNQGQEGKEIQFSVQLTEKRLETAAVGERKN